MTKDELICEDIRKDYVSMLEAERLSKIKLGTCANCLKTITADNVWAFKENDEWFCDVDCCIAYEEEFD